MDIVKRVRRLWARLQETAASRWDSVGRDLFSDAETTEDRTQQIIRGVRAGDFAERVMCLAQLLGAKL